jgi:hypothetical protein
MKVISVGNIKTGRSSVSYIMRKHWSGTTQDRDAVACAQWEAGMTEPVLDKIRTHDYFTNFPWCNLHKEFLEQWGNDEYRILHCVRPDPIDWVESYAGHVLSLSPDRKEDGYMWYPAVRSWEPIVTPELAIQRHQARDEMLYETYKDDPNYLRFSFWEMDNVNELSEFVGEFNRHNHVIHENANRLKNYGNEKWLEENIEICMHVAKHIGTESTAKEMIDRVIKRYL